MYKRQTYDSDGNVIYICDQKTAYTMEYQDSEMKSLKVGNIELVNNSENIITVSYTHLDVYKRQI